MTDKVIHVAFKQAHAVEDELVIALKDLVYSYSGRITTVSVFGAIEIVKHDLEREIL